MSPAGKRTPVTNDHHYASDGWHECHDGTPLDWDTNNFHIWWNIDRIY